MRMRRRPLLRAIDQLIPFVALGHGIGRIGCFLNGCCYGKPTEAWYGVGQRIPTQLIEAALLVGFYGLLRALQRPTMLRQPGRLFGIYLVSYALIRFLVEYARGDQTLLWNLWTLPQLMSLVAALVGLFLIIRSVFQTQV